MNIRNTIKDNCIDLNLKSANKSDVIKELIEILYKNKFIDDKYGFFEDVCLRESIGSTGIGNHIAIPHGKSKYVKDISIIIGKTKHGIDWGSVDDLPVNFFILFAVPDTDDLSVEMKIISDICIKLADDDKCRQLLDAKSNNEVLKILSQ